MRSWCQAVARGHERVRRVSARAVRSRVSHVAEPLGRVVVVGLGVVLGDVIDFGAPGVADIAQSV